MCVMRGGYPDTTVSVSRYRLSAALSVVLLAVIGLSACGGGVPGDAVAQVDGSPIAKATFDHWMDVAAASTGTSATSRAVVPVPPDYTACISQLEGALAKPARGKKTPSAAHLKSACEQRYKSLETRVLAYLISADWVIGEGVSLGVKLSDAEVKKQFVKEKVAEFPEVAKFQAFLRSSGETVSDLLLSVKLRLLQQKIEQRVVKNKGHVTHAQQQAAFTQFVKNFKRKWLAKTECRPGYIVVDCKQYKVRRARGTATSPAG